MVLFCPPKLTVAMRYIPLIPRTYGAIRQRFSFIEFAGEGLVVCSVTCETLSISFADKQGKYREFLYKDIWEFL